MKSKQVLDVQQMQHLQELGLKLKPSLVHYYKINNIDSGKWYLSVTTGDISHDSPTYSYIPAYTLQDVLDALPKRICDKGAFYLGCYDIMIDEHDIYYAKWCGAEIESTYVEMEIKDNLIDAAYNMLCWCIEQGYVETNKNK